jgi:hypothetical protein
MSTGRLGAGDTAIQPTILNAKGIYLPLPQQILLLGWRLEQTTLFLLPTAQRQQA